ncbi:zinc-binding alcohol dehydrogenase [Pseudonocardia sp.]|jgi:2-desacetyl-2-hydroxyethyl bacteriochlorophyllide A dehydrogenase|uniref:zinc-dependent alcohol dehydrogenase n=1 Tax=Pseudonocardia sp. TaxID=60912 RepID=UPI0031FBC810
MDLNDADIPDPLTLLEDNPLVVTLTAPRRVEVLPQQRDSLPAGHVRLRTLYSGISAGTELTLYRGTNPHLERQWDASQRLFVDEAAANAYPNTAWGYSEVGEVSELGAGVDPELLGTTVWGLWGHRGDVVLPMEKLTGRLLPAGLDPLSGTFARVGAVALNAVLAADMHIGETVAIFGQGVLGLIATQLAVRSGAEVVAVDGIAARREQARTSGAALCLDPVADDVGARIKEITDGRGADVCIEISGSYRALHEAMRTCAAGGRVVAAGFYQGDGLGLRLGEEFHHNRVQLVSSQISSAPQGIAQRWSPERMHRTVIDLIAAGELDVLPLVSHVVPVRSAPDAYALLDADPAAALQVVLDFGTGGLRSVGTRHLDAVRTIADPPSIDTLRSVS